MSILPLDELPLPALTAAFNQADHQVAAAVEKALPAINLTVEHFLACLQRGGRIFYLGSGSSGKAAFADASECPPTFGIDDGIFIPVISGGLTALSGWREETEDDFTLARSDLASFNFSQADLLLAISASGATPYALSAIEYANEQNAMTLGLCCQEGSELERSAKHCITVDVGPEIIAGSTRLKAGSAQKMVLNMLSSCTMIKAGKVYDNLMVDVRPLNQKLKKRVLDIICQICACSSHAAEAALTRSNGQAKLAILMLKCQLSLSEAETALCRHNGHLKRAIRSETHESNH
ncbi:N-acetylmuramic acid 6-phosphate etherase [Azotosporobacter soli]|uniref:N-acetylmuramic acid 6-phosphate etherase n=1 Tax=Azotosporobacter soli TaxID=3055040 RepID=UPI0031FF1407